MNGGHEAGKVATAGIIGIVIGVVELDSNSQNTELRIRVYEAGPVQGAAHCRS
jgi:hypothetical protein